MLQLKLLAVQPDQGNNLVLAERAIKDFMVYVPPNPEDQLRTLESVDNEIAAMMLSDARTRKLLEIVRAYVRSQIDQLQTARD
jgi:hypothetical protein